MNDKTYKIYPGARDGHAVWYIEYEDGTEDLIRMDDVIDMKKELNTKVQEYLMKKRKEKINKILNGK